MIRFFLIDHIGKKHIFLIKTKEQEIPQEIEPQTKIINTPATPNDMATILEILELQGIDFPYSCRAGACTSCCCNIKKGKENLNQMKAGEPIIDITDSEFLTCIGGFEDEKVRDKEIFDVELESQELGY